MPDRAFILAAGKGTRLRPYTDSVPKPMVEIGGRSIIKRTLDKLAAADVRTVVVNTHHLGHILTDHLKDYNGTKIILSPEEDILDTGGGVKNALHYLGREPFFIINGDALWDERHDGAVFQAMASAWRDDMDILLFLEPEVLMDRNAFAGDYDVSDHGKAVRSPDKTGAAMFAGVRIAHPRIFDDSPDGAFSFLELMDRCERQGRLYGILHDQAWYHISTPEDLERIDRLYRQRGL